MKIGYFDHTAKQWCEGRERKAHQSVTGISACGEAGLGKSVAMKLIPEGQPQVIQHTQYTPPQYLKAKQLPGLQHLQKQQPFPHVQIVYLHVQCPVNSRKPSNMARAIFAAADEILDGTNYRDKYGHGTMTDLELNAAILAKNHSLGVLIIDEIQRLVKSEETMNFLIDLNNIIGVPIVSIGTEKSIALFKGNGSVARRGNKMGDHHWKRMLWSDEKDRKNWNNFMKVLWPHQVVQHMVEFDESLSKLFWQQCRGIPDYGVKLFRLAQCRAMESGVEKLTPEVIISATDNFSFSQEILAADKK